MSPHIYFKQYIPDEIFDLMADSTNICHARGTLRFKTALGENRTLVGLQLAMGVMEMPRVLYYWEAGIEVGIFRNTCVP